jgi:hypothetical protein
LFQGCLELATWSSLAGRTTGDPDVAGAATIACIDNEEIAMHEPLTIDHVVDYFHTEIARHTLQGTTTEVQHIQRGIDYLARVG